MREIKFRVWHSDKQLRSDTPRMEYFTLNDIYWRGEDTGDYDFPGKLEVMQYTGLHDKNGKEIYEGDIIKQGDTVTSVIWNAPKFELKDACRISEKAKPLEVIGNIYENPALLEVT